MFPEILTPGARAFLRTAVVQAASIREHFYLAWGTGLALHLGHRESQDLDFFSPDSFRIDPILGFIREQDGKILIAEEGTIHAILQMVKVSFLYYPYPLISSQEVYGETSVAGIPDIACMKFIAISQRGEKKDFYDIYELLHLYDLPQLKDMLLEKYGEDTMNIYHIGKSLLYFDEAEETPTPRSHKDLEWETVKTFLRSHSEEIAEVFLTY